MKPSAFRSHLDVVLNLYITFKKNIWCPPKIPKFETKYEISIFPCLKSLCEHENVNNEVFTMF